MARPKKEADARKSRRISLRLTETEYEVYKEFARRGGFTVSELIRLMMVNGKVSYRMPIVADMPQLKESPCSSQASKQSQSDRAASSQGRTADRRTAKGHQRLRRGCDTDAKRDFDLGR